MQSKIFLISLIVAILYLLSGCSTTTKDLLAEENPIYKEFVGFTEETFTEADRLAQQNLAPDDKFYTFGLMFEVKKSERKVVYTGIQNFGEQGASNRFRMEIEPGGQGGDATWFTLPPVLDIEVGDKKGLPFEINVPADITADTVSFTVRVFKDDQFYASQNMALRILSN